MNLQVTFRENNVNQLIETTQNENGEIIVSGRDLHEFLEVDSNYTTWFKRMSDYGFLENDDYIEIWSDSKSGIAVNKEGSSQSMSAKGYEMNHVLKLDMAKQIGMIQKTEKGKKVREYFIQLEKFWNSPEMIEQRYNEMRDRKIENLTKNIFFLETKVEKLTHSGKLYTADEIAKELSLTAIKLNKLLHAQGFQYKRNNTWLPYTKYADKNLVSIKQGEYNGKVVYDRKFTEEGRQFILDLLEAK